MPKPDAKTELVIKRLDEINRLLEKENKRWLQYLVIRSTGRSILLRTSTIDWIEAKGNYVSLHRGKESSLARKSLSALEKELDPKVFVRVHRSAIVNIDRIREFQRMFNGEYRILLNGGTRLPLGPSYRPKLQELIGGSL
jgi:two-component system, LytTR family, response regulator